MIKVKPISPIKKYKDLPFSFSGINSLTIVYKIREIMFNIILNL